MLDVKQLRKELDVVKKQLATRGGEQEGLNQFEQLDSERRALIVETEELKSRRNQVSQDVAKIKREKGDADALITEMKQVSENIKGLDEKLHHVDEQLNKILYTLPNLPHESVPVGESEEDNEEERSWGEAKEFSFEPKPHWDLASNLGIVDFERAAKVTGSRFVFYRGMGARLERALINFMMDLHADEHGYEEVLPPYMVNRDSMLGTGQLPKFEEDAFKIREEDYFLIPTAEVPVTNLYRDEIIEGDKLPLRYAAYSACFRSEAGSAGRDTRGLIRQHQFNKVEMLHFCKPEDSYAELEKMTGHAEKVLKLLDLPYRVLTLCTADMGFTAAKTYDLEVWLPSYGEYREISSCSNVEGFQARRANIRFKREAKGKAEHVHTLNGSGLAVGRTVAAILENYQQEDGTIKIPEVLQPYMGGKTTIQ
ncbi:serine--tRNA ligase [Alkalicoccobacillus murimartini]|uniref:Serine--tRNA ligase n=1 Tax=Alkalicoccobacillus murimartini TaxID=171685 RepID=A0ABT9YN90_9BACI|nr:serine--tRNA ligase [Alkalicoccobacillus murimartini]MDQ0209327.1 seryl-tRNA synthetase [Alkalicoccobacillus murimartini]